MSCSRRTTQKRISLISADIAVTMESDLKSFLALSIACNESADMQDNPQLANICSVSFVLSYYQRRVVGLCG